ncbi:MAG TPA: alpha-L-arabinofuranosidase C-terminal domain-containing protein [Caulobacterales bacterium]|nr:alpha-L-arabinofuranosidase C-terminal domain-containing protein [Caulobacterales bacterium]
MLGSVRRAWGRTLGAVIVTAALAGSALAQPASGAIDLTIQARNAGATINRDIFGQFAEHLGAGIYGGVWVGPDSPIPNVRGIRTDVVQALRALHVPNVRWPGGCFADEYHWRNGVGPRAQRSPTINANWGGVNESNQFGTDEFFDFIDQIGSEAYVSINVGSGTVKEAADWLDYMTGDGSTALSRERVANGHRDPYRIHMLGIGNESWGCGGSMRPEFYVDQLKMYSRFVRNYNPAQREGASVMHRIAVGADGADTAYTEAVMSAWKNRTWAWDIEGLSLHFYTVGGPWPPHYDSVNFGVQDYAPMVADTLRLESIVSANAAIMDRYDPEKKIGLMVDEWGVWLAALPHTNPGFLQQQNSLRDAIIAALDLNIFARHADRVRGANIAQMINVLQSMVITDGPRMVLTPTYHVFRMYAPFQDAALIPVSFSAGTVHVGGADLPRVDAVAARDRNGVLWLAITNIDPEHEASLSVAIPGATVRGASGEVLTAARVNAINTFDAPDGVRPRPISALVSAGRVSLTLPSKSVTVLRLTEGRG